MLSKLYSIAQMKKPITITTLALLMTITLMSQLGCSEEPEAPTTESNRWLELLSVLPANENTLRCVYLQDLAYLWEKTDPWSSFSYPLTWRIPLFGDSPRSYSDEEWKETLGFTLSDVDQTVFSSPIPPRSYEAVRGRFNHTEVDDAARTGPGSDLVEVVSYQGHEYYNWGEDFGLNMSMQSNVRPLGRGHRLALVDDFVFWVLWTDGVEEMIDSYEGSIDSLADVDDYRLLSEALVEMDTVTAYFSSESQAQSHVADIYRRVIDDPDNNERRQLLVDGIQSDGLLKPYQALATGAGVDEQGYYMVIVLLNPSEEVARDNAALLERRIGQVRNVENAHPWIDIVVSMEIESQGRLTLAKLYGSVCTHWGSFDLLGAGQYEPLLLHE